MKVALDPNVVVIALYHRGSYELLRHLSLYLNNAERDLKIARDEERIQSEYNKYFKKRVAAGQKTLEVIFLNELLSRWDEWTEEMPMGIPDEAVSYIDNCHCPTDIEPILISLAGIGGVVLGAVGPGMTCDGLQQRNTIHDEIKVRELRNYLPEFELVYSEGAVAYLEYEFFSDLFEIKVSQWVKKHHKYPTVETNHYPPYLRRTRGAGEIDVYGFDYDSQRRSVRVVVCECKLRMPGSSHKLVGEDEIEQLAHTFEAATEREKQKWEPDGCSVKTFGLVISNADGMTEDAQAVANRKHVQVLHAQLPDDWHRHAGWEIQRCDKMKVVDTKTL